MQENQTLKFPTETIKLPTKGLLYPEGSYLSKGEVELKYPTAYHEDILTNPNYIDNGTVLDKFLSELLVEKFDVSDLLLGDKNALLVAARVMAYGSEYRFSYRGEEVIADLSKVDNKEINYDIFSNGQNLFTFTTPKTGVKIEFSFLTGHDEKQIAEDLKGYKKINKALSPDISLRYKRMIKSVNGDNSQPTINRFVDSLFIMQDTKAFKEYLKEISPDIDLTVEVTLKDGSEERINIPLSLNFFWPDITV